MNFFFRRRAFLFASRNILQVFYYSALYLVQIQRIKCILIVTFCDVCKSVGGGVKCRKENICKFFHFKFWRNKTQYYLCTPFETHLKGKTERRLGLTEKWSGSSAG